MRKLFQHILLIAGAALWVVTCSNFEMPEPVFDRDEGFFRPTEVTALVTVKCSPEGTVYLQYGDYRLLPEGLVYNGQQRAMAAMTIYPEMDGDYYRCDLDWIEPLDMGSFSPGMMDFSDGSFMGNGSDYVPDPVFNFAGDGLEVLSSAYTCVEDGYLSVHYNTWWGEPPLHHDFKLVAPDFLNPFVLELVQDSHGDAHDTYSDGLVCFDINGLPDTGGKTVTLQLNWTKPNGDKGTAYFGFKSRE